jgi:hypothetical protein
MGILENFEFFFPKMGLIKTFFPDTMDGDWSWKCTCSANLTLFIGEQQMNKFTSFALYVSSIVIAIGIGMGQVGWRITEQGAALPKCKHGPMVKPACIGSDGCDGATYKTYLLGTDTIASEKQWPAGTPASDKNQCFVSSPANPPGQPPVWNLCDANQPYYTTDDACTPE